MVEIAIALISVIGGVIAAIITQRYRKQETVDTEQEKLIETLKDLVEARDTKIQDLEALVKELTEQVRLLRLQVLELREVIVHQALLIQNLSGKDDNAPTN